MFFRQLMWGTGVTFFVVVGAANAKVAPDYLPIDMLDVLPELHLQHGSARQMCPIPRASDAFGNDLSHLDGSHLYDWAHPIETRAARERCAMPAPDPDLYENIG